MPFLILLRYCTIIMEWIIVKFLDEDEVETVPLKWITADKKYCYFPSLKENVKQAIKNCLDINPTWQKYEIDVISRKSYTKFATANAKASKACFVSDLSECDNANLLKKRESKKKTFYGYTTDTEYETESEAASQEMPQPPDINDFIGEIDIAACPIVIDKDVNSAENTHLTDFQKEIPQAKERYNENRLKKKEKVILSTRLCDETLQANMERLSNGQLEQEILRYLIANNKMLKELRKDMYEYQAKVNNIINQIGNVDTTIDEKIMENLPLSTLGELNMYENELHDANSIKRLATGLARLGGTNYKECIRRIMSKVMTDELASHFSYKGHKSKKNFSQLQISVAVLDAVKLYDKKETSIKEMESVIAIWLSKASERLKTKR